MAISDAAVRPKFVTSAESPRLTRTAYWFQRSLECLPAILLLVAGVMPAALIWWSRTWAYVGFSCFVLYWTARSAQMAAQQLDEYIRMRRYRSVDWTKRLQRLADPYAARHSLAGRGRSDIEEFRALGDSISSGAGAPAPDDVYHLVVLPVSTERYGILRQSLNSILAADYPSERLLVCLSFEERCEAWTLDAIASLSEWYVHRFGMFLTSRHPDSLPNEARVKGANLSWGARVARAELQRRGITDDQVVVSAFDADTRPGRDYFKILTYTYLTNPQRDVDSYQPVLLFHNNIWDVPVVSRLVGFIATMWTMVDSTRPKRLRIFSSHAIGMRALVKAGFWSLNVIPDDSRQYWRMFYGTDGQARTVPLHTPVHLDAVQADSYRATLREQYLQIRRWSYGVIDFPYIMEQNLANRTIPWAIKLSQTHRQFCQFHFWATVPILLLVMRPLIGVLQPQATLNLVFRVHFIALNHLLTGVLSAFSLTVTITVALVMLPPRPPHQPRLAWLKLTVEWLLLPIVVPVFLCIPAIDAQLRLLARRYLGFRVTVKSRPSRGYFLPQRAHRRVE